MAMGMPMGTPEEDDLSLALSSEDDAPDTQPSGGGLLDSKPPELRVYLEDAVDDSLSPVERAEALCKAIEFTKGAEPAEDVAALESDSDY